MRGFGEKFDHVEVNGFFGGVQVAEDNTQGPYEGSDDALIGIQNSSSKAISAIPLSAENSLFGFENDGLCKPGGEPVPAGCVVQPKNSTGGATANPGEKCPPGPEACSFPPPAGEPAGRPGRAPSRGDSFPAAWVEEPRAARANYFAQVG